MPLSFPNSWFFTYSFNLSTNMILLSDAFHSLPFSFFFTLQHQDDAPRYGVSTLLQVRNQVGRILRTNEENAPMEEEEELGGEVYDNYKEIHRHNQHAYESPEEEKYSDNEKEKEQTVHDKIQIKIPRDEFVNESIPILDTQWKNLPNVDIEGKNALYPLKPEDLEKEVSKFTDWNAFKRSLEEDWEKLEVKLCESSKWLMQKKNNEWSNWIQLVKSKWSVHGKVPNEEELDGSVVEPDWSYGTWGSCFKTQVYPRINSQLKNWLDDTHSNLFKFLVKGLVEVEDRKIKGWLMYHWKMNEEDDDYKTFGIMPTAKFLNLAQSRQWYHDNPHIDKQRRELMLWFSHRENEYLGPEWENWTYWKNEKINAVKLLCAELSRGCMAEGKWKGEEDDGAGEEETKEELTEGEKPVEMKEKEEAKEEVKEEVKKEIKEEVKEEIKEEVKEEIKEDVKEEIKEEVKDKTAGFPLKPEDLVAAVPKFTDWNTFKQILENDWEGFKNKLNETRERWMQKSNDEWASWIHSVENKWSEYNQVPTKKGNTPALKKQDCKDSRWKKWFNTKVKFGIHSKLEKWLDDTHSNLFKILLKDTKQFKGEKIKEWLVYHWKINEGGFDYKAYEALPTLKFLHLALSRKWYSANPNIDKEIGELMSWFYHKENEYLGQEWEKLAHWKNEKVDVINSMCARGSIYNTPKRIKIE
eukprot:XP_002257677.1 blood stage membrane protein, putative [Plasmodium knowlesi strain H]